MKERFKAQVPKDDTIEPPDYLPDIQSKPVKILLDSGRYTIWENLPFKFLIDLETDDCLIFLDTAASYLDLRRSLLFEFLGGNAELKREYFGIGEAKTADDFVLTLKAFEILLFYFRSDISHKVKDMGITNFVYKLANYKQPEPDEFGVI